VFFFSRYISLIFILHIVTHDAIPFPLHMLIVQNLRVKKGSDYVDSLRV